MREPCYVGLGDGEWRTVLMHTSRSTWIYPRTPWVTGSFRCAAHHACINASARRCPLFHHTCLFVLPPPSLPLFSPSERIPISDLRPANQTKERYVLEFHTPCISSVPISRASDHTSSWSPRPAFLLFSCSMPQPFNRFALFIFVFVAPFVVSVCGVCFSEFPNFGKSTTRHDYAHDTIRGAKMFMINISAVSLGWFWRMGSRT
ncbi:hypothetical protein PTI98_007167 [Pleurotus ostreatus]|nr:hypothetical protein PTI98_009117 [Pleurotus ostreatus]KAJ8694502.1 hypothetical protein PTI98_007167 [Pleurotus ostreatus]